MSHLSLCGRAFLFLCAISHCSFGLAQEASSTIEVDASESAEQREVVSDSEQDSNAAALEVLTGGAVGREGKSFFGSLSASALSDFRETGDRDKEYNTQYSLMLGYRKADNIFSINLPWAKRLSGDYKSGFFMDARASYTKRNLINYKNVSMSLGAGALYPTTETSRLANEMYTGLDLSPQFLINLNDYVTGLTLFYMPRVQRRFHRYTTDINGRSLAQDSLLNFVSLSWSFSDRFVWSSSFIYSLSRRYDGVENPPSYALIQELMYIYSAQIFFNLGLDNGDSLVNYERGESAEITFYDPENSRIYAGVRMMF